MPQVIRIWRRRSAEDISYVALLTFIAGVALWLWYGLLLRSLPIEIANGVTLALNISIFALKLHHHDRR